jgi:hypothetical protein
LEKEIPDSIQEDAAGILKIASAKHVTQMHVQLLYLYCLQQVEGLGLANFTALCSVQLTLPLFLQCCFQVKQASLGMA